MAACCLLFGFIRTHSTAMLKIKIVVPKTHHVRCVHATTKQTRSSEGKELENPCSLQLAEKKLCLHSSSLELRTAGWQDDVVVHPCLTMLLASLMTAV